MASSKGRCHTIEARTLSSLVTPARIGETGCGFRVDPKGYTIVHPEENAIMKTKVTEMGSESANAARKRMVQREKGYEKSP